jgi:hypothetical protein
MVQEKAANRWLELQFGWKPLLSDVYGATQKLAEDSAADPAHWRFRVVGSFSRPYTDYRSGDENFELIETRCKGFEGRKYVVWYRIQNDVAAEAARSGLLNPATVAWELLPFSFVADWFAPIGSFINSLDATVGKEFLAGTTTDFVRVDARRTVRVGPGYPHLVRSGINSTLEYRWGQREVLADFPSYPHFVVKSPLSFIHASEALALLTQALKRF